MIIISKRKEIKKIKNKTVDNSYTPQSPHIHNHFCFKEYQVNNIIS